MKQFIFLLSILFLTACGSDNKPEMSEDELVSYEEEIDLYVKEKLDTSQLYDIIESLRFSKENESYAATQYSQNDTSILINEKININNTETTRNTYYRNGFPVFIEEYIYPLSTEIPIKERKIYLDGETVVKVYERAAETEIELEGIKYKEGQAEFSSFDFERPVDAINQEGEFELKFGEFLVIEPQQYLILENPVSNYNVALYLMETDFLIDELRNNPSKYEGKTIFAYHQFMDMNGINRMIYLGGIVKED